MMRSVLVIVLCMLSFGVFASDGYYRGSVSGREGSSIHGTDDSIDGDRAISGEITEENNDTRTFRDESDESRSTYGELDEHEQDDLDAD